MKKSPSRRTLIGSAVGGTVAAALSTGRKAAAQKTASITGFDHVALPMQNVEAMLTFYRGLGLQINEGTTACSVYIGNQMINFHRPERWPLKHDEPDVGGFLSRPECAWISRDLEQTAQSYAVAQVVPEHLEEVKSRKLELIAKTEAAVKERLTKEISYWDHRAEELKLQSKPASPMRD